MTDNTDRDALLRVLVEVERGKMTDAEWHVARKSLSTAHDARADAILAEFLPAHDERVKADLLEHLVEVYGQPTKLGPGWIVQDLKERAAEYRRES